MYRLLPLSLIAFAAVCGSPTAGESLWPADENKSVCADRKAHKVGDVLTVVIVESATSSSSASTETSKDSKLQAGPGTGPVLDKIPLLKLSGGDQMKADGSTTRTRYSRRRWPMRRSPTRALARLGADKRKA